METSEDKWERINGFFFGRKKQKRDWNTLMWAVDLVEQDDMEVTIIEDECEIYTMGYKCVEIVACKADTKKEAVLEALNTYVVWFLTERKVWIEEGKI